MNEKKQKPTASEVLGAAGAIVGGLGQGLSNAGGALDRQQPRPAEPDWTALAVVGGIVLVGVLLVARR